MQQNISNNTIDLENIAKVGNIEVFLQAEYGTTVLPLQDAVEFDEGTVIKLDNFENDPVNVFVNGVLIAKAKIVALEGRYGIKIVEIVNEESLGSKNG